MSKFVKTHEKEVLTVLVSFISLLSLKGIEFIVPIITLPYLIKTIGFEKFGILSFAMSFAVFLGAIIQYGFQVTATKNIARNKGDKKLTSEIFYNTFYSSVFLAIVGGTLFIIAIKSFTKLQNNELVFIYSIFHVVTQSLFPIWFFQGVEKLKLMAYISTAGHILFLFGLFTFVTEESDYYLIPAIYTFSTTFILIASLIIISRVFQLEFIKPNFYQIKNILFDGRHAFITQLAPNLYNNSSTFILAFFTSSYNLGNYSAAMKMINIYISLGRIISASFFPFLARNFSLNLVFQRIMILCGLGLTIFALNFSDLVSGLFFTNESEIVTAQMEFLSISIIGIFLWQTYGMNLMMISEMEKKSKTIAITASLVFLVITLLITPIWGAYGAIFAIIGGRLSMGLYSSIFYYNNK